MIARSVLPVERHTAPRSAGVRAATRTRRRIIGASGSGSARQAARMPRAARVNGASSRGCSAIAAVSTGSYGSSRRRCSFAGKYRKNVISVTPAARAIWATVVAS